MDFQEKIYYIYKHENRIDGKVYIGQTCEKVERRWRSSGQGYGKTSIFAKAIKRYGWSNFSHEILASTIYEENANWLEKLYIEEYRSTDRQFGYNLESGGKKNKSLSIETREKLRIANIGKKASEETKRKMSLSQKGRIVSAETRAKISRTEKGKVVSKETKKKLIENGKLYSKKGKEHPNAKAVFCITNGTIYDTVTEAAKKLHLETTNISSVCKGKLRKTGGYVFRYISASDTVSQ